MTADEWDACTHFPDMVYSVRLPDTVFTREQLRRRGRLFGCASMRSVWDRLPVQSFQPAVLHIEENAATYQELPFALALMEEYADRQWEYADEVMVLCGMNNRELFDAFEFAWPFPEWVSLRLFRDIFGNPFRPVAFNPAWRSEAAVALARAAYEARNFTLLPILADALEEAGCDHADVLAHCRQPDAVHVRGCWVVDLVLRKK